MRSVMLKKLRLRDFQKWKSLTLYLDPHVTTLTGPSGRGKSSVIRALRLLALNQPDGRSFVRHGAKEADVSLDLDSHMVGRRKGKKHNLYLLDKKKLPSFGRGGVPDQVAGILRLTPENFQRQKDPDFWLGLPPAEVARRLNDIVNLSAIDSTLAEAGKEVRRVRAETAVVRSRLKSAEDRRKALEWVPRMGEDFRSLVVLRKRAKKARKQRVTLQKWVRTLSTLTRRESELGRASTEGERVVRLGKGVKSSRKWVGGLKTLIGELEAAERALAAPTPDLGPLLRLRGAGDQLAEDRRRLEYTITDIKDLEKQLWSVTEQLSSAEKELAGKAGRCPTCGSRLSASRTPTTATPPRRGGGRS